MRFLITTLLLIFSFQLSIVLPAQASEAFPVEGPMRVRVDFWKKVYTEITTKEAFIHDPEDLSIVYKKVSLPNGSRRRSRAAKKEKREIAKLLRSIAKKNFKNLNAQEEVISKLVNGKSTKELYRMAKRIRYQYGLKDRYYKGLIRSYKFLDYIKRTFSGLGLPPELVYLPHVESSFNYKAYSKVGAAGIWQFMRSTGRLYGLKINYIIDERRDPLKATRAAARLLRDNYNILDSWPLALTAYNHGARSMSRAVKRLGTTDINVIIQGYEGRRFGFASKNFYATFMATVEISKDPGKYFPSFSLPERFTYSSLKLKRAYTVKQISKALNIGISTIREYNHSIRRIAYRSNLFLPKNFDLKIPTSSKAEVKQYQLALSKLKDLSKDMDMRRLHIVSRGESLYSIARIYRVNISDIIQFNRISNPSIVYPGMKIKIPGKKDTIATAKRITKTKIAKIEKERVKERGGPKLLPAEKSAKVQSAQKIDHYTQFMDRMNTFFTVPKTTTTRYESPEISPTPETNLSSYLLDVEKVNNKVYRVVIETEETIGHLAEWAQTRSQKIRNLNRMRRRSTIRLGQTLLIPMDEDKVIDFKRERAQYHLGIQEDFYGNYNVTGQDSYTVRRGDTLNGILRRFSLPFWLVRSQQPENKISFNLKVGDKIVIPKLEPIEEEASLLPTDDEDSEN
jgi:membrane-bound lytic murein transglycosylase D